MIGCDIIEIERIKSSIEKFGDNFINKIMTCREIEIYNLKGKKAEFAAGRFAAKEAVAKSFGLGIGRGYAFTDIEVLNDSLGKPEVYVKNERRNDIEVSISHSRANAIAVCVLKEGV